MLDQAAVWEEEDRGLPAWRPGRQGGGLNSGYVLKMEAN